ncbi:hypothetical protein RRF57_010795 [Xylaria bambusicola]|uniref:Uncharacterized protein n=1 Tax=Xylaria bambusicola TaxID=326684 RepID=A0AAN7UT38_9PEZI
MLRDPLSLWVLLDLGSFIGPRGLPRLDTSHRLDAPPGIINFLKLNNLGFGELEETHCPWRDHMLREIFIPLPPERRFPHQPQRKDLESVLLCPGSLRHLLLTPHLRPTFPGWRLQERFASHSLQQPMSPPPGLQPIERSVALLL